MMSNLPPAIPNGGEPVAPFRLWEVYERVTAFEDREHELLRPLRRSRRMVVDGQVSLDG